MLDFHIKKIISHSNDIRSIVKLIDKTNINIVYLFDTNNITSK